MSHLYEVVLKCGLGSSLTCNGQYMPRSFCGCSISKTLSSLKALCYLFKLFTQTLSLKACMQLIWGRKQKGLEEKGSKKCTKDRILGITTSCLDPLNNLLFLCKKTKGLKSKQTTEMLQIGMCACLKSCGLCLSRHTNGYPFIFWVVQETIQSCSPQPAFGQYAIVGKNSVACSVLN